MRNTIRIIEKKLEIIVAFTVETDIKTMKIYDQ